MLLKSTPSHRLEFPCRSEPSTKSMTARSHSGARHCPRLRLLTAATHAQPRLRLLATASPSTHPPLSPSITPTLYPSGHYTSPLTPLLSLPLTDASSSPPPPPSSILHISCPPLLYSCPSLRVTRLNPTSPLTHSPTRPLTTNYLRYLDIPIHPPVHRPAPSTSTRYLVHKPASRYLHLSNITVAPMQ